MNDPAAARLYKDFLDWFDVEYDPDTGGAPPFHQDDLQEAFEAGYKLAESRAAGT